MTARRKSSPPGPSAALDRVLPPGALLGRYRVVRTLNTGGMGVVYEALHAEREARVAIKVLHPRFAQREGVRARFIREPWIVAQVRHPNTLRMLDSGEQGGLPYLVMELLEGEDLAAYLDREAPMTVATVVSLLLPVLGVLGAAHEANIVHQDLTPANIFVTADGHGGLRPVVLDFGIARHRDDGVGPDASGCLHLRETFGTMRYMAPEQLRSGSGVEPRSDQFATALIAYECLTGRRPFAGSFPAARLRAITAGACTPPGVLRPDLPEPLDAAIRRSLRAEPAERFPTMEALSTELRRALEVPLAGAPREHPPHAPTARRKRTAGDPTEPTAPCG